MLYLQESSWLMEKRESWLSKGDTSSAGLKSITPASSASHRPVMARRDMCAQLSEDLAVSCAHAGRLRLLLLLDRSTKTSLG